MCSNGTKRRFFLFSLIPGSILAVVGIGADVETAERRLHHKLQRIIEFDDQFATDTIEMLLNGCIRLQERKGGVV